MFARILVPFVAASLLLASGCGDRDSEEFVIAVSGPISAANGMSMGRAAQMAVAEINASARGPRLRLLMIDDHASVDSGTAISFRLANNDSVVAVVGHLNSAVSMAAADAYNGRSAGSRPVVQLSPASSAPQYSQAGPWSFRITPTDLEFAPVLATAAAERGLRRAAVLYVNDDYGRGVRDGFGKEFRAAGGSTVSADPFVPALLARGDEMDAYLQRAMNRGAEALVIGGQAETGVGIMRAARRLGFTGPILGADGMTGARLAGPIAEGLFVSSAFLPDRDTEKARAFVQAYRAQYGDLPDHRGAMTYDAIFLLRDAIAAVGGDRRAIRDWLAARNDPANAFEGVSGAIAFNEDGDVIGRQPVLGVVRNGELVTAR
jgi:branched-chain amino acid transport system substrate-binding protein